MSKKISWWTFKEVLGMFPTNCRPAETHSKDSSSTWFKTLLNDADMTLNIVSVDLSASIIEQAIQDLMDVVYNRHVNDYYYEKIIEDNNPIALVYYDDVYPAMNKILNVIEMTSPKYIPLLSANKTASADLLQPMRSATTSTNRFNDTPQYNGNFNDDEHATNASQNVSETTADSGSLAQRLDELFKNYRSIILEWSNEFNMIFLKEEQL